MCPSLINLLMCLRFQTCDYENYMQLDGATLIWSANSIGEFPPHAANAKIKPIE